LDCPVEALSGDVELVPPAKAMDGARTIAVMQASFLKFDIFMLNLLKTLVEVDAASDGRNRIKHGTIAIGIAQKNRAMPIYAPDRV
jgi:hypothetical protein